MFSFDDFTQWVHRQRTAGTTRFVLPVYRRRSADLLTPVAAYLALRRDARYGFLLESVEGGENLARYSFLGRNPYRVVRARGSRVTVEERGGAETSVTGNVFDVLQGFLDRNDEVKLPGLPRFACGAVGYLGYDAVRLLERLPDPPPAEIDLPDAVWGFYDTVVAFDHVKHQMVLMAGTFVDPETDLAAAWADACARLDALEADLDRPLTERPEPVSLPAPEPVANFTREAFEDAVRAAKHHIHEGDIFQVVLSQRFSLPFRGDRFNLYRALRQVNPSPYLFYLDFDEAVLIGSSPEVLVRVENRRAEVLPIAGTRPRGRTLEEDTALEAELLADPKERAEHLMLVDLGRNDLGRVCDFDSVQVDRYAFIERFSHVMHIVSQVSGLLPPERKAADVLAAAFPAGTVSGAPKVRAMQLIDALEPTRRGVYAGAVGYLDFSGNLDTCIAIRTMVVKGSTIYLQAGAGIVADSDPAGEYQETLNKAGALRQAIALAADGSL